MKKNEALLTMILSFITTIIGIWTDWLGILAVPIGILVAFNIIDYITGIVAAKYRDQVISSYVGLRGIFKKVCMWILIYVVAMVDILLNYGVSYLGLSIKLPFVLAIIVTIWLICNETISILENIKDIGVKIPSWLIPLMKNIRKQADEKANSVVDKKDGA